MFKKLSLLSLLITASCADTTATTSAAASTSAPITMADFSLKSTFTEAKISLETPITDVDNAVVTVAGGLVTIEADGLDGCTLVIAPDATATLSVGGDILTITTMANDCTKVNAGAATDPTVANFSISDLNVITIDGAKIVGEDVAGTIY